MVKFSAGRNPGGFDQKKYYNSLGLCFEVEDAMVSKIETNIITRYDFFYRISDRILKIYKECLPGEEAGFLASITIGNKSDLLGDLKDLFQLSRGFMCLLYAWHSINYCEKRA